MSSAVKAENLEPDYLKVNPNGTVPTVIASSLNSPLVDTRPILKFLDRSRPARSGPFLTPTNDVDKAANQSLIDLVHSNSLETSVLLFGCLNAADIDRITSSPLFDYLAARQQALKKHLSAEPTNVFYRSKLADNGKLYRIFTDASQSERDAFFKATAVRVVQFADSFDELERHLRLPYAIGDKVSLADLHIVPWLSHSLWAVGTLDRYDFSKLEYRVQRTIPDFRVGPKVRGWWANFTERDSFRKVFQELH